MNAIEQIKKLRAEGKYEEGYQQSLIHLRDKPIDQWAMRIHGWSVYYMIKKHVQAGQSAQATHFLREFDELQLPKEDALIHERIGYFRTVLSENHLKAKELVKKGEFLQAFELQAQEEGISREDLAWTMYYLLREGNKSGKIPISEIRKVWNQFRSLVTPVKKLVYKLILQEVVKSPETWWVGESQAGALEYLGLVDQLEEDDYQRPEVEGKKLMPLAERLHIVYSKALLREGADGAKIRQYLEAVVEPLLEPRGYMQYVPYFKAKLLLGLGDKAQGMKELLPFVRKKQEEFWVWQVLAEAHEGDVDLYLACLCKAASCRTRPEFLCGIRERLLVHLIKAGLTEWASVELDLLVGVREKMGWGLRAQHRQYQASSWYVKGASFDPKEAYSSRIPMALGLLEEEGVYTSESVLVTGIQAAKGLFYFLSKEGITGVGKYVKEPRVFGIYRVWGRKEGEGMGKIERMEQDSLEESRIGFFMEVEGRLRVGNGQAFGFVGDVFVEPKVMERYGLRQGMKIRGEAVRTVVKGKKELGWKLIRVMEGGIVKTGEEGKR